MIAAPEGKCLGRNFASVNMHMVSDTPSIGMIFDDITDENNMFWVQKLGPEKGYHRIYIKLIKLSKTCADVL